VPHDPKKPFDAPPGQTPELLQKDLSLDRRTRRAPSFEELRAQPAPPPSPAEPQPAPAHPRTAAPAAPQPAPARPRTAAPAAPPRPEVTHTAPPSPTDWARAAPPRPATAPPQAPVRAQPPAAPAPRAPAAAPRPPPPPVEAVPPRPSALPADLLVTQPGSPAVTRQPAPREAPPPGLPPDLLTTQPGQPSPASLARAAAAPPRERPPMPVEPSAPTEERAQDDDVLAAPASLWRRLAAWLLDAALLGGVVLGLLAAAAQVIAGGLAVEKLAVVFVPGVLLAGLLAFVYATLFAFVWGGRSPGRRLLGLHLVDDSGQAPSPIRALCRGALSLVSFGLFLSGFWIALFDRRGQTLHDKLCSTFVVQLRDA
jgi:uncharacterized RDD family membrane protein YckC